MWKRRVVHKLTMDNSVVPQSYRRLTSGFPDLISMGYQSWKLTKQIV